MTQRNAALAEQGTAAAMSLNEQAHKLSQAVAVFHLSGRAEDETAPA
jgi:methyl-accepting chemotaxis protein